MKIAIRTIVAHGLKAALTVAVLCVLTAGISVKEIGENTGKVVPSAFTQETDKAQLENLMKKHLDAVTNRDLETLKSTLSPQGNMQLILPGTEIIEGVGGFIDYHKEWFEAPDWTFETKILNTKVGEVMGMAIVEIVYREPERDGAPYFNRMIVSYDLQKTDNQWYVIKDHASSVEKSTDL